MTTNERTVEAGSEEFQFLVEAVEDYAIFLLSPTGEVRTWNRGAARIMGYATSEVLGRSFALFFPKEDVELGKPDEELVSAARDGRIRVEGWRIRKDGRRFWANAILTALRSADGEITGFAKVTQDLTERRMAEERLRRGEEQLRLLVDSVKDYAIFMLDVDGNVATWNSGAQRIKGYLPEEIIGRHFSTFYSAADKWKPARELEIAKREGSVEDEGWRLRKDGTRFWANVVLTAMRDEAGVLRGFAKVTRDVTSRKEAEETQRALQEQREARLRAESEKRRAETSFIAAEEANRTKDEFLMTLSHELRTPLTSILGWSRLLTGLEPEDPEFKGGIEAIARSAELQARLIDDVLDVSRIVSGKLQPQIETVDLVPVLRAAVETVVPTAVSKNIRLNADLPADLGAGRLDGKRLQQIVWNLLANAVKFTPSGGSVNIKARSIDSNLQVTVQDNGIGIAPEFLPHVFEPFRQAEGSTTRQHGGLGLGLSIVRYLVHAHGGTITAASEGVGRGATFEVIMPVAVAGLESPVAARAPARVPALRPLEGIDLLLLDDDLESRSLIGTIFTRAGASVRLSANVGEAMRLFTQRTPDLIVTDIGLPGISGLEFVRMIRARQTREKPKIAVLTAFAGIRKEVEIAGADEYFLKPMDPEELVAGVAALLPPG